MIVILFEDIEKKIINILNKLFYVLLIYLFHSYSYYNKYNSTTHSKFKIIMSSNYS